MTESSVDHMDYLARQISPQMELKMRVHGTVASTTDSASSETRKKQIFSTESKLFKQKDSNGKSKLAGLHHDKKDNQLSQRSSKTVFFLDPLLNCIRKSNDEDEEFQGSLDRITISSRPVIFSSRGKQRIGRKHNRDLKKTFGSCLFTSSSSATSTMSEETIDTSEGFDSWDAESIFHEKKSNASNVSDTARCSRDEEERTEYITPEHKSCSLGMSAQHHTQSSWVHFEESPMRYHRPSNSTNDTTSTYYTSISAAAITEKDTKGFYNGDEMNPLCKIDDIVEDSLSDSILQTAVPELSNTVLPIYLSKLCEEEPSVAKTIENARRRTRRNIHSISNIEDGEGDDDFKVNNERFGLI